MKKTYMLMAAALVGMTAVAAPRNASMSKAGEVACIKGFNDAVEMTASQSKKANVKANKPASTADMEGLYEVTYRQYMLTGNDPYNGNATAYFTVGDAANQVLIDGIAPAQTEAMIGSVDFSKGTVTIKTGQNVGFSDNIKDPEGNTYTANLVIEILKVNYEAEKWENATEAVGTIQADGTLDFGDYAMMFEWQGIDGYNYGIGGFTMTPKPFFSFDPSKWTKMNDTQFTDNWVNPVFKEEYRVGTVSVNTYCLTENPNIYCFVDPYDVGGWKDLNEASYLGKSPKGYIVVDTQNPQCVLVQTLVPSGLWLDMGTEEESDPKQFYMFNEEGMKFYQQGYTTEEQVDAIYEVLEPEDDPDEVLAAVLSNKKDNVITIRNMYFGQTGEPVSPYWWTSDAAKGVTSTFVLDPSGISNVEFDATAPVKYYNLQGVQVMNPAKGQLVIKTQGNKAEKVIVK